jgi:hypothetical protein
MKEEGIVKFFGSQSSIKKPIVGAKVGSTCGLTVVVSVGLGFGAGLFFLSQVEKRIAIKKTFDIKPMLALVIIGNLFIICVKRLFI